jgi:dihydrofolate reductase
MTGNLARGAVQYFCAQTLDGFIAEADGGIRWLSGPTPQPLFGCEMEGARAEGDSYEEFFAQVGALAMGRDTYEGVVSRYPKKWPYGLVPSWVFTNRRLAPPYRDCDIRRAQGPVRPVLEEMHAAADGKNIWIVGGGKLATQVADQGLLDELRIMIVPVVLGSGIPTFAGRIRQRVILTDAYANASGTINLRLRLR